MSHLTSVAAAIVLAYFVLLVVRPFVTPLLFAVVMVVMFDPLQSRLERHLRPSAAAAWSTLAVVLLIIVPAMLIGSRIVAETIDLGGNVRPLPFDGVMARAQSSTSQWGLHVEQLLREGAQQLAGGAGLIASRFITNTWALFIGLVVAIHAMFFLFREGEGLLRVVIRATPLPAARTHALVDGIGGMIRSNIAAPLLPASIQGTIGGAAFAWFGFPAPVLWGVVMGFFCLFPFVGAWLVWVPAALVLALADRPWDALLLTVIGLALMQSVDNLLRPAAKTLNGLLLLIGLFGGIQAFGASGLLLGPAVMSVTAGLLAHRRVESSVASWPKAKSL